ncbi:unnamed protein product [Adineta steineri]|uniref:Uncharacterized protein n=1 Tax=Adineta steineri TaxID=433720 RepID=A0A820D8W2_9BILA|nr:unnamed protein product [Adineta steineri]
MQEPSIKEDHSQKETILSTKCRFLLWSCVVIPISIMISIVAVVIFIRYQSSFSSINEDSLLDIVVANINDATISIYYGSENGEFQSQKLYSTTCSVYYVTVRDMNNDNKPDITLTYTLLNQIAILINNGNQNFNSPITYPVGNDVTAVSIANFNNDSYPDFVTTDYSDNTISFYIDLKNGLFKNKKKLCKCWTME